MSSSYNYDWHQSTANIPTQIAYSSLKNESIYKIDLEHRTIEGPEFLSVQEDHHAELILFEVDRYFGSMDLADACCVIQFDTTNAQTQEPYHGVYPVQYYDLTSRKDKIIIPWSVPRSVTQSAQEIIYNVRFFVVNLEESKLDYNLNTLPASTKILSTLTSNDERYSTDWSFESASYNYDTLVKMYQEISREGIFWENASDLIAN